MFGLMAIPYIDNGPPKQETAQQRGISTLFTTVLLLWGVLTIIGLFFRGPNWDWQLPWDKAADITSSHTYITIDWLFPVLFMSYAALLIFRLRSQKRIIKSLGVTKYFIFHSLVLAGIVVTSKIILLTILSFTIKQ
jgi:hypothetical protein